MKMGRGFFNWNEATMETERRRYQSLLLAAARLLESEISQASQSPQTHQDQAQAQAQAKAQA